MPAITHLSLTAAADKSLVWAVAKPKVIYGENDVTDLTIAFPTALAAWTKYVEFETQTAVPWVVDGATVNSKYGRLAYMDGMTLPSSLINGRISRLWAVAVGSASEVFKSLPTEFPYTEPGITPLSGVTEPLETISTAEVDGNGHLIITKLDLTTVDAGSVIGPQGDSIEYLWDGTSLGVRIEGDAEYAYVDLKGDTGAALEFDWDGTQLGVRVAGQSEYSYVDLKGATGNSIEYGWDGTQLGVRVEGESEYQYVDLKGDKGDTGTTAYQSAVAGGYTGSEAEFNALFAGLGDISAALDAIVG